MKLQIMTLVKNIISKSVVDILHKKLGPGDVKVSNDDQSCSLIRHREDHVWIWNAKGIKKKHCQLDMLILASPQDLN